MLAARAAAVDAIVNSVAAKRLIVAGPGTGKTTVFGQALQATGSRGLVLTFIRKLVADFELHLSAVADAYTFHAYCNRLIHQLGGTEGLTANFALYPQLLALVARDLKLLWGRDITKDDLDRYLHYMDVTDGVLGEVLARTSFYDAAGFTDVVYRVVRHLERRASAVPRWPLIVVDEYQDFSLLETRLLDLLARASPVLIAGDDDQALYEFKHASALYIRSIASEATYERFTLPYCSRCPEVIVDGVKLVIRNATARGLLVARLEKPFEYFPPEKAADSRAYPKIVHAACSVQSSVAPYVARYIVEQVARIPDEDIAESERDRYWAVLILGPKHYLEDIHAHLIANGYSQAVLRVSKKLAIDALDGYVFLSRDPESKLGWRILLEVRPPGGLGDAWLRGVLNDGEIVSALPDEYRIHHLAIARTVGSLLSGQTLSPEAINTLARELDRLPEQLKEMASRGASTEAVADAAGGVPEGYPVAVEGQPSILLTTIIGAKGLSGGHVFIAGFNNGELPHSAVAPTDTEVCQLLVGLSRTHKQVHLVSNLRFAGVPTRGRSEFVKWLLPLLSQRVVDKNYWARS